MSKKATIRYNLASDLPATQADASQIHQIILNLVINASDALGEKGGVIVLSTDTIECDSATLVALVGGDGLREGLYVRLEVSDTGCGMDQETQNKMFDPFFTTKFTGRGLGLAAVHGIIQGHRGAIRVISQLGQGTTFQVLFPASGTTTRISTVEPTLGMPWRGTGTVLVVDDEEMVRTLACRMAEHAGFAVLKASDGEEAVRVFRQHKEEIICVLLDMTMPKMNGEETFHALRQICPNIRVILSSGYSEEAATERLSQLGLAGFIQKPYQFNALIAKIRGAFAGDNHNGNSSAVHSASGLVSLANEARSTTTPPTHGTVLIVDDDELNRTSTQVIFKQAGFSTLSASDGEKAIRVFQEHRDQIICVLLDLTMPKMNGEETFRVLRQLSPKVRVIVTSGYSAEILANRFTGLDVFGFVCKPEPLDDQITKLRDAIGRGQ